jgi:hypothetical protein
MPAILNSPDVTSLKESKEKLEKKIESIQKSGININPIVNKALLKIDEMLLPHEEIAKKLLIIRSELSGNKITEDLAELIIYGTADDPDNNRGESFSIKGIDKKNPIMEEVKDIIKTVKDNILQLGIKSAEFIKELIDATTQIITSIIALAASVVILPFGSGIPTAITAVKTMLAALRNLKYKAVEILPLLGIVDFIALILPEKAQFIIGWINIVIVGFIAIMETIDVIINLMDKVTSSLDKADKKMKEMEFKVECSATPSSINKNETVRLNVSASGGDWNFTYKWLDQNDNVIGYTENISLPLPKTTRFKCIVTDGTGLSKSDSIKVKVD